MNLESSQIGSALETLAEKSQEFGNHSVLLSAGRTLVTRISAFGRGSYCYRWLTKEPEPEVIVIDLRETRTIGPVLAILGRVIEPVERAWTHSQAEAITTAVVEEVTQLPGYDLAVKILEPPEPPENDQ
jgi:hypothetical protein